jgi:hypothetical protein
MIDLTHHQRRLNRKKDEKGYACIVESDNVGETDRRMLNLK